MEPVTGWPTRLAARSFALQRLTEATAAAARIRTGSDPEALHDFRVAVRRLRAILKAYRPWLRDTVRGKRRRRLGAIAAATGRSRDVQVQRAWVAAQGPRSGPEAAALGHLARHLEKLDPPAADLEPVLRRFDRQRKRLDDELRAYTVSPLDEADDPPFGATTATLAADRLDALRASLTGIACCDDPAPIHRARLDAKRLRYLLESMASESPECRTACRLLARLQDTLGHLNDSCLLGRRLEEAHATTADSTLGEGLGQLGQRVIEERRRLFAQYRHDREEPDGGLATVATAVRALEKGFGLAINGVAAG